MKRSTFSIALAVVLTVALVLPLGAAPTVSKRVVDEDGKIVVLVRVAASEGVKGAITRRDGPFADYSQGAPEEKPRRRSQLT